MAEVRMDVYVTLILSPDTGCWVPLGTNATLDGALAIAEEATDALMLSLAIAPERMRQGAEQIIDTIKVVPAVLFIDEDDLRG